MKKITIVDSNRINSYLGKVSIDNFYLGNVMVAVNSGKNHYDIADVFTYFVDTVYKELEEKKAVTNNKLSKYIYAIKVFVDTYNNSKIYIGDDLVKKIESLSGLYIDNRSITGKNGDSNIIDMLELIKSLIQNNQEFKNKSDNNETITATEQMQESLVFDEPVDNKSIEEYQNIVNKLQKRISDLEMDLAKYQLAVKQGKDKGLKDAKEISKLNKKIDDIKELNAELRKLKRSLEKDNDHLNKKNSELGKKNEEQTLKIAKLDEEIVNLNEEKDLLVGQIQNDDTVIETLNSVIDKKNQELDLLNKTLEIQSTSEDELDNSILDLLLSQKLSIHQIMDALLKDGFDVSQQDILDSLKRINRDICVKPVVGFNKQYGIVEPAYHTNIKFNYPNKGKTFDVIFLADYHYDGIESGNYIHEKLDTVYNYCAINGIDTIISLGDLIDSKNISPVMCRYTYDTLKKFLKDFDRIMPYDVRINHFILGGNHDKEFLKYGIDPLEQMSFDRQDTTYLGYSNAYMFFGGSDIIGLHHEGVPRESSVPDLFQSGRETIQNLQKAYDAARLNMSQRYFDFFGHFHKSRLDILNSFGIVPSLNADRNTDGAWHVTFVFDDNGRISNFIIKNLSFGRPKELKTTNEVLYQRTKK